MNCTASDFTYGFHLVNSFSDTLKNNNATGNGNTYGWGSYGGAGFDLKGSSFNTLTGNTANENGGAGTALESSSDNNTLTGNIAGGNAFFGLQVDTYSSYNKISGNIANGNDGYGVITVRIDSNAPSVPLLNVDGRNYTSDLRGSVTFLASQGEAHYVKVNTPTTASHGTRFLFSLWYGDGLMQPSRMINSTGDLYFRIVMKPQYLVVLSSSYGEPIGEGWYDAGSHTNASIPLLIDQGNQTRRVFTGWYENGILVGPIRYQLVVQAPSLLVAGWKTQYFVNVSSSFSKAQGTGWYDAGSKAEITISGTSIPIDLFTSKEFAGWKGDASGTSANLTITVDAPKNVTAVWVDDYARAYLLLGALGAMALLVAAKFRRRLDKMPHARVVKSGFVFIIIAGSLVAGVASFSFFAGKSTLSQTSSTLSQTSSTLPNGPLHPNVLLECPTGKYLAEHDCVSTCPVGFNPVPYALDLVVDSVCMSTDGQPVSLNDLAGRQVSPDNGTTLYLVVPDVPLKKLDITGKAHNAIVWLPVSQSVLDALATATTIPKVTTEVATLGDRVGYTFTILKINPNNVSGDYSPPYPVCCFHVAKTIQVGDDIGVLCEGQSERLASINFRNQSAVFIRTIGLRAYGCPVCLSGDTYIDTPEGQVNVKNMTREMPVWTMDRFGNRVIGQVLDVRSTPFPVNAGVIHIVLADGRQVFASPGHPTADGRTFGQLKIGDRLDNSTVALAEPVSYAQSYTYDLLPSGDTGFYWASGILVGSTLALP